MQKTVVVCINTSDGDGKSAADKRDMDQEGGLFKTVSALPSDQPLSRVVSGLVTGRVTLSRGRRVPDISPPMWSVKVVI